MSQALTQAAKELLGKVAQLQPFRPGIPQRLSRIDVGALPDGEVPVIEDALADQRIENFFGRVREQPGPVVLGNVTPERLGGDEVVLRLITLPIDGAETSLVGVLPRPSIVVEDGKAAQPGNQVAQRVEVLLRCQSIPAFDPFQLRVEIGVRVAIGDVERVDPFIPLLCHRVVDSDGEFSQDIEIGRAFDIEHVAVLDGADVVLGAEVGKGVADLRFAGQVVRVAAEQ